MKIHLNSGVRISGLDNNKDNNNLKEATKLKNKNVTNLSNMPNYRYMVSFGAKNDNLELLYNAYSNGKGMPVTYSRVTGAMTHQEREKITDVYAHYKSVYADMENCHTVDELKAKFPDEFSKLESALTRKDSNGSFLTQLNSWAKLMIESNEYLFPETKDNDLSVYLAKKIFFEAKTKKEIKEDFAKDINKILSQTDINELGNSRKKTDNNAMPDSVFSQLGLIGDFNSNGFRHSLSCSRESYIEKYGSVYRAKRIESLNKNIDEVTGISKTEKSVAPRKNTTNYEKSQYAMFYVWNKSLDLRHALSDFLVSKNEDNELLKPDFMDLNPNTKSENAKKENQKSVMLQFWESNPELRADFKEKCNKAFDIVEQAIDNGTFDELKKDISSEREEIYRVLQEEKRLKEALIAAEKTMQQIMQLEQMRLQEIERQKQAKIKSCSELINYNMKLFVEQNPIPRAEVSKTSSQIQTLFSNADEMTQNEIYETARNGFNALHKKVNHSVNKAFSQIIKQNVKKITDGALDEVIKQYPQFMTPNDTGMIKSILQDEIEKAGYAYEIKVFRPYLCYLSQHSTGEISKIQKKEVLKNLYSSSKESSLYNTEISTNARKRVFDDLQKIFLNDISAKEMSDIYKKSYATTPLVLECQKATE